MLLTAVALVGFQAIVPQSGTLMPSFVRRRNSALFLSTALVGTTAGLSGAWATDECGPQAGTTVICTAGNPYPTGITYTPTAPLRLDVLAGANVIGASTQGNAGPGGEFSENILVGDPGVFGGSLAPGSIVGPGPVETSVIVNNAGTVTIPIGAVFATGIYGAVGTTDTSAATLAINNTGSIGAASGVSTAFATTGISATVQGTGALTVQNSGQIAVPAGNGILASAISAASGAATASASVDVQNSGAITLSGPTSTPLSGIGIGVASVLGAASATNSSTGVITSIMTSPGGLGPAASGIGMTGSTQDGSVTLTNNGIIVVGGPNSSGMTAGAHGTAGAVGLGSVTVINTSSISSTGSNALGIDAFTDAGVVTVINSGTVTGSGSNASGVDLSTKSGAVVFSNSGSIGVDGVGAAVTVLAGTGSGPEAGATLTNLAGGTISSAAGIGILQDNYSGFGSLDNGNVFIENAGTISGGFPGLGRAIAIRLGSGRNTLLLDPGFSITGLVQNGRTIQDGPDFVPTIGVDTLNLGGTGTGSLILARSG